MDIRLTMEEAEEVLFALALRSKQSRLSPLGQRTALAIGERLDHLFTAYFGWDKHDRMAHMRKPIKRVTVTTYDYPPRD